MGRPAIDHSGKRVGMLTVIERDKTKPGKSGCDAWWICKCDCGNIISLRSNSISGKVKTKSCGCLPVIIHQTHGKTKSRLYNVWNCMKQRCFNANNKNYKEYGARGITMCDEWKNSFEAFYKWSMANGYDPDAPRGKTTIDRIDNDGNYEPQNCRWVSMLKQSENRRRPGSWKTKELPEI